MPSTSNGPRKLWVPRSLLTNASIHNPPRRWHCPRLCTWAWMEMDYRCAARDEGAVPYSAASESAATADPTQRAAFTERVLREATRRRFCQAKRRVVLGDGAPWIWNIAHELFPGAIQIVDRFHAKQHLSDLGKAIYGPPDFRAAQWAKRRHVELDDGRFDALLQAISRQIATGPAAPPSLPHIT